MEWLDKMNAALDYIEENLTDEIDLQIIAQKACCSSFNFQRMFSFIADVPLAEYIRRRRLSAAAFELINSDIKIIDLAIKYGYDSSISFSRAFQKLHNTTPSKARELGASLQAYPRITFEITIKGVEAMQYRIEEKEAFRMVGIKRTITNENGENFKQIPAFWEENCINGEVQKIKALADEKLSGCYGVCTNFKEKEFEYFIAVESTKSEVDDMEEIIVPRHTWVMFECRGTLPEAQQSVWKRIFTQWFPTSGYEHAAGPELEWYSEGNMESNDYISEIWIPIIAK